MSDLADAPTGQAPAAAQPTAVTPPAPTPPVAPTPPLVTHPTEGQESEEEEYDAARAMALIRKLRLEAKTATAAIKERDTLKAAQQAALDAQLSKEDQLSKRAVQLEAELTFERADRQDRINRYEVQIAATRLGIVDADAAVKLLDWTALEYGDDGAPQDIDRALKTLIKARPYLAGVPATPQMAATNGATRTQVPGQRTYTTAELNDYTFYAQHRDDIVAAMREGRIARD